MGSKKKGVEYLLEDLLPSGGDPALMMGTGKYSDRYITASDSAFESYSKTRTGKADDRYNGTESGMYLPTANNWRQDRLAIDVSNPYYQEIARKIGINQLSSANDMGQVLEYLENQNKPQVAAAPATPTPEPEPQRLRRTLHPEPAQSAGRRLHASVRPGREQSLQPGPAGRGGPQAIAVREVRGGLRAQAAEAQGLLLH
jgi:hypothetical protein